MNTRRGLRLECRHPLLLALIALLWLLMQQQLFAHAISHVDSKVHSTSQDKKLPGDSGCERCLSLSPLGASLGGGDTPQFILAAAHEIAPTARIAAPQRPFFRHFDSQAPPSGLATI